MLIHELTPTECRDILSRAHLCRLACSRGGQPYLVPISFAYDPDSSCLFCFSMIGKKIEWMRRNPKVCVEVEDVDDRFHWTTILIFGRYDEILDGSEERINRQRALEMFGHHAEWWLPGAATFSSADHHDVVIYRILVESMTGRRAGRERS
jgi:nitroimidazol reductase NimA-like FMN-containing flavoprotein (pyridoxamine 5'-phosphate oxidase superfamily)